VIGGLAVQSGAGLYRPGHRDASAPEALLRRADARLRCFAGSGGAFARFRFGAPAAGNSNAQDSDGPRSAAWGAPRGASGRDAGSSAAAASPSRAAARALEDDSPAVVPKRKRVTERSNWVVDSDSDGADEPGILLRKNARVSSAARRLPFP
jgi:hypothetical protein